MVLDLIVGVFGFFGNGIVFLMYIRYIIDKSGIRYFILILVLVDFIGCVLSVSSFYLDNMMRYVYLSENFCKILFFLIIMFGGFFVYLIFVIVL